MRSVLLAAAPSEQDGRENMSEGITAAEIAELCQQIPDWRIVEEEGSRRLKRTFGFRDFAHALAFTNLVGGLAEEEEHHPSLLTEWGKVTVTWWTHSIGGLHRRDFLLAAATDRLYRPNG
jgi:4a-hydroxytetrahydrobiopterin dehydratase